MNKNEKHYSLHKISYTNYMYVTRLRAYKYLTKYVKWEKNLRQIEWNNHMKIMHSTKRTHTHIVYTHPHVPMPPSPQAPTPPAPDIKEIWQIVRCSTKIKQFERTQKWLKKSNQIQINADSQDLNVCFVERKREKNA